MVCRTYRAVLIRSDIGTTTRRHAAQGAPLTPQQSSEKKRTYWLGETIKEPETPRTTRYKQGRAETTAAFRPLPPARAASTTTTTQPTSPRPAETSHPISVSALVRRSSHSARNGDPPGGSVNLSAVAESEPSTSCTTPVKTPRCQSDMYVARPPRSAPSSSALVRGYGNPPALGTQTCVPRDIKTEGKNAICRTSYRWNR